MEQGDRYAGKRADSLGTMLRSFGPPRSLTLCSPTIRYSSTGNIPQEGKEKGFTCHSGVEYSVHGAGIRLHKQHFGWAKDVGTRAYAATVDPVSGSRSSADSQYGRPSRSNLNIFTEATARRIIFSSQSLDAVATGVKVEWNRKIVNINANKDVIPTAGAFNSPKWLELSGVGQKDRLSDSGIPVVNDQPGVGEILHNHLMSVLPTPLKAEGIRHSIMALAFTCLDEEEQEQVFSSSLKDETLNVSSNLFCVALMRPLHLLLSVMLGGIALLVVISSFTFSRGSTQQDLEVIKKILREAAALTTHHTCGTVAMLPRQAGGRGGSRSPSLWDE
ncbi:hypothetical protein ABOM_006142 [Aspergillus bombycis]|uniref:Glucose-methanol-choline oxidoreductase N-terminal domain-containing protein n=1 Tax=Aspergillus bombycis TaxID=109264 RepID=A0A1F7ZZM3_9EURO|nr:hypothetical protein ABOM_006142 [Aspergillus bombycis]OGM44913.1 hypothetical protein ABOM_006142 [Aspergillus bombycis]